MDVTSLVFFKRVFYRGKKLSKISRVSKIGSVFLGFFCVFKLACHLSMIFVCFLLFDLLSHLSEIF